MRRQRLANVLKFAVFYGRGHLLSLLDTDLVILEPSAWTASQIREYQSSGALCMAYVSVVEVAPRSTFSKYLTEEDYLAQDGTPVVHAAYGNRLASLGSRGWRSLLLQHIGRLFRDGYDGVFLDTLGDLEWPSLAQATKDREIAHAVDFAKRMRTLYPDHIIMQNNGIRCVLAKTAQFLDAVVWESPGWGERADDTEEAVRTLVAQSEKCRLRVFLLSSPGRDLPDGVKRVAEQRSWLHYQAGTDYLEVP